MKNFILLIGATLVSVMLTAQDLAVNGDFETGDNTGWTVSELGGTFAVTTEQAQAGTFSGKLSAGQAQEVLIKQANLSDVSVTPNTSVTITFDMYGTLTGAGGVVFPELFSELSGGGTSKSEILSGGPIFPTETWTSYSYTTTTGPDVSGGITLQLKAGCGSDPCTVDAYFDNVTITMGAGGGGGGETDPVVFDDDFGTGVSFVAFGGSINDVSVVTSESHTGTSSLQIEVPAAEYTGGAFVVDPGRDVSGYDKLTFWAKASKAATLNVAGVGNDNVTTVNQTEVTNLALTTEWQQFTIVPTDPSVLTANKGLFHFAEGADEGIYTIWLDDIVYEVDGGGGTPSVLFSETFDDNTADDGWEALDGAAANPDEVTFMWVDEGGATGGALEFSGYNDGDPDAARAYLWQEFYAEGAALGTISASALELSVDVKLGDIALNNTNVQVIWQVGPGSTLHTEEIDELTLNSSGYSTLTFERPVEDTNPAFFLFRIRIATVSAVSGEGANIIIDNLTLSEAGGGGDTTPPVITLLGDATVTLAVDDPYTDAGATATDDTDGDITGDIVVGGDAVDTSVEGTYVITYNVMDAAGNAAEEVTRTVIVGSGVTLLDFENALDGVIASQFSSDGQLTGQLVSNPVSGGINTSANVYQINYQSTNEWWGGVGFVFGDGVMDDQAIVYKAKLYSTVASSNVLFQVEQFQGTTSTGTVGDVQTISNANQWTEVTFTIQGTPPAGTNRILIRPDVGGQAGNKPNTGILYVDDIVCVSCTSGGGGEEPTLGPNLVINGGFEDNGGDGSSWLFFDNNGSVSVTDTDVNSGTYAVSFVADPLGGPAASAPVLKQEQFGADMISPGDQVRVTFNIKATVTQPGAVINVALFSEQTTGAVRHDITLPALTGDWQTISADITTAGTLDPSRGLSIEFQAACGPVTGCNIEMYIDDVSVNSLEDEGGGPTATAFPVDFEDDGAPYVFGDFGGGTSAVIDNPQSGGINTSAKVARMQKFMAADFGGTTLTLDANIDYAEGQVFKMKVWASREVPVTFKLEQGGDITRIVSHTGSSTWEELTFDFSSEVGLGATGAVSIFFDNGEVGDAAGNPDFWTFYYDDISQEIGGSGPTTATFPVDFEDAGGPYTLNNFNGGASTIEDNPDASGINTSAKVVQMQKFPDQNFGGTTLVLDGNIDYTAGQVFKMKVWASREVPVTFKLEQPNIERVVSHSGSGTWEELTFDFSAESGLVATNAITLIFDNGVMGAADTDAPTWTFYYDDIDQSMDVGGGDTTPPVITLIGDATVNVALNDTYTDAGATATDDTDGDITEDIVVGGDVVDTSVAGTYTITYNVMDAAGNAADEVTRTVIVAADPIDPVAQTITFPAIADKTLGDSPFTLTATASSQLDVSFSSSSDKVDVTSAGEVTLLAAGSVTIDANQAGNSEFLAAPTVSRTFCINPMKPVITVNNDNTESVQLESSSSAGNQWFLNGEAIASATGATLNVDSEGIYSVQVTIDGCSSEISDDVALIVTSTGLSNRLDAVTVYPNPSSNLIQIKGFAGDISGLQLFDLSGRAQQNTFRVNGDVVESDISTIPNGVYLLMINSGESAQQIRIVKN
ncbi:immunoglobulin-like domain-containing protein [Fulvivirga lutea]|uniref:DUF5011 domain-containing protein n=1 Tax=Fulvivirga lutea TaxID=2810512 RepID=A0A974WFD3_9BACT|nr:immunoglobulin-like domain-containing protein [Fulvivirga lutea]QSE97438.1 DUF5011 domain-containing protein [Fulvivirga lutea]